MKKALEIDVSDLQQIMEGFVSKLESMPEKDLIDLAARLKPVAKSCEAVDKHVKALVKTKMKGREGAINGGLFKAVLKLVETSRLDQAALKADDPELFDSYCKKAVDERITFEVR